MIYRGVLIKNIFRFITITAAVFAGLTTLAVVSSLSNSHGLSKKHTSDNAVRINLLEGVEKNFEPLTEELPPVLRPKELEYYPKPAVPEIAVCNIQSVIPRLNVEQVDIKPLYQDLKLSISPGTPDMNCRCKQRKCKHDMTDCPNLSFDMREVDVQPQEISAIHPFYPYRAKRLLIGGYVTVRFLVDTNGNVSEVTIVDSNPAGIFEQSVRNTLPRWKFRPGKKDDRPVRTWVEKTIEFTLDSNS